MARRFPRALTWAAIAALVFFLLAAGDLALRSRAALNEAIRQEAWLADPAAKKAWFDGQFTLKAREVELSVAAGKTLPEEAARQVSLLAAERDFRISESSAKSAYIWYKTAAEEFRSPFNPWAKEAAARQPGALAAWKAELAASGVKPEPWMLQ
ncbi:MAG: hypothetical protein HY952_08215 [Elusimicrobia bacterium]|jgi:hypothetical protein|nr:hypothetical protein [Elusimicrobiota bacterium]